MEKEKSPAVQLTFQLRASPSVRSVHLLGSWDGYKRQLPLSMVKDASAKPGSWKGTFRFQGSQALRLGGRYWYYYIVDGYHVSHDPAKDYVTEKTTGRKLNVLNVPGPPNSSSNSITASGLSVQTQNLSKVRHSREIPHGRSISPSQIECPRPQKPYESRYIREADYDRSPVEDLEERFASSRISDRSRKYQSSPSSMSDSSSGPEFSDPGSSLSSSSSRSSPHSECRCGRFGVTRDGRRVKIDCGGRRCGNSDSSASECSHSSDSEGEHEKAQARRRLQATMKKSTRPAELSRRPVMVERRP